MSGSAAVLDTQTPNGARAYDYLLGDGKASRESFPADRDLADRIAALYPPGVPGPRELAAANRTYLELAVEDAVEDGGIGQVLDLGAGFPAPRPLHEVARAVSGQVRTAYVDLDRTVVSHGRALVEGLPGVTYAEGDLTRPGDVLANPDVRSVIDPALPVAAIFGLTLHFLAAADARRVIEGWAGRLAPGSRFAVTVAHWPDARMWERIRGAYGPAPLYNHTPEQVHAWFRGLDLLGGKIDVARGWGPEVVESQGPGHILAGVARKP